MLGLPGPIITVLRSVGPALITDSLMVILILGLPEIASIWISIKYWELVYFVGCRWFELALLFTSPRRCKWSDNSILETFDEVIRCWLVILLAIANECYFKLSWVSSNKRNKKRKLIMSSVYRSILSLKVSKGLKITIW